MANIRLLILISLIGFSSSAFAITPLGLGWNRNPTPSIFRATNTSFNPTYRIGDEWGKKPVTEADLESDASFKRMALATARVGGATGFFLGEFNGHLVMATNHHVCPEKIECLGHSVQFPLLNIQASIVDFYGTWTDIDLALFEIRIQDEKIKEQLLEVSSPFAFDQGVYRKQKLVTIGFGAGDNPRRQIVANRDSDCIVFSAESEFRFMADPDDLNPGPYKAWSFSNGCDVSHGDSGSAMMDRDTGSVIGIIWTGRIPKSKKVQNSAYLQTLIDNPSEDIWKELSFAVPAVKMKEFLLQLIAEGGLSESHKKTVESMF